MMDVVDQVDVSERNLHAGLFREEIEKSLNQVRINILSWTGAKLTTL